jgi:hypothetical protein
VRRRGGRPIPLPSILRPRSASGPILSVPATVRSAMRRCSGRCPDAAQPSRASCQIRQSYPG